MIYELDSQHSLDLLTHDTDSEDAFSSQSQYSQMLTGFATSTQKNHQMDNNRLQLLISPVSSNSGDET